MRRLKAAHTYAVLPILLALGVLLVPGSAAASGSQTLYGLHQDLTYDGHDWRRALAVDRASRVLGAKISRNSMMWHKVERTAGTRDWTIPDRVVGELSGAGIEPLFVLVGTPVWANGAPADAPDRPFYIPTGAAFDPWLESYVDFVREAVRRYRGRVNKWEVWNEENEHYFWKPGPDVDQYLRLYTAVREAILAEDPDAEVAVGGLAGLAAGGDIPGIRFLQGLVARGAQIDHVAIHPYPSGSHAPDVHNQWQDNFDDIGLVHDYLQSVRSQASIWVTEWGWPSVGLGEETQARYLQTSLEMLRDRYPYVSLATYFVDYDRPEYSQGLFDSNFDPKPAAARFARFMRGLGGTAGPKLLRLRVAMRGRRLKVWARARGCSRCSASLTIRVGRRLRRLRMRRRGRTYVASARVRRGRTRVHVAFEDGVSGDRVRSRVRTYRVR